jgi:hypothetical protein
MSDRNNTNTTSADSDFNMALGWLAAAAISIASWAGLN